VPASLTERAKARDTSADAPSQRSVRGDTSRRPETQRDDGWMQPTGDSLRRHPFAAIAVGLFVIASLVSGTLWWLHARNYESTDDAFVDARIVPISSQVAGEIVAVPVTNNQHVNAGSTLFRIDDRDYRAAFDEAKALVEQADATIANIGAQISAQQARVEQAKREVTEARGALTFAQEQNARAQDLVTRGVGTVEAAQQTSSVLMERQAAYNAAVANETATTKQIHVLKAQQQVARAGRDKEVAQQEEAGANLARTVIKAPVDGFVTKITAAKGAFAQPGQTLIMFVPVNMWVTANFKETQLDLMRPGQPVAISIDAYPGRTFHGHVDSIQAGSGAAFSLLPPENATGNYVKVVQRVPVKIAFDKRPDVYIGPGMSVEPTVKVR
jgi:membrane fusion protein (multidrug efflux system)